MVRFLVNPGFATVNDSCGCNGCFGQSCNQDNACIGQISCGTQGACMARSNCQTNATPWSTNTDN